jgi:VCBS repeat-containing protein
MRPRGEPHAQSEPAVGRQAHGGIADIQAAILAGADPTQVTDPTAAGAPAAGGSEEGAGGSHKIIVIEQANSSIDISAGFATFGAGIGFPNFEFQLLQAGVVKPIASLLPLGPTVLEGTNGGSSHVIHFTIQLDKTVPVNVGVNFLITPPGADGNGSDISSPLVGTAVILAGTNSVVVDVSIVQDHFVEFNEPVSITLTEAINAVIDPAADTATITIVDDDVNPVAVDDTNWVQEDTAANASGNVLENHNHPGAPVGAFADVQDVDTDPIHVTTSGTVAGTYGSLVLNADGSYAYTLYTPEENAAAHAVVQALKANDAALIDSFTYSVSDGFNTPSSATLKISVFGTNDAPVLEPVDVTGTVYEAGLPTDTRAADPTLLHTGGTFHITDTDGDELKLATVQFRPSGDSEFIDFPLPEPSSSTTIDTGHGILTISSEDGGQTWNWTYDLYASVPDGPGVETDQFRVTVTDGTTEVTTDIFASIVLQDDVPQAVNDTNTIAEDAASVSGNVLVNDLSGADTPKTLQAWGNEAAQYGTLTKNADGSYVYALNNGLNAVQGLSVGETLTETFTYTMKDSDGDTSSATLTITITGTDDGVPIVGIGAEGGDQVVFENDLADGSSPNAAALTQSGSFTIEAKDGIAVLRVGDDVTGATLTVAQLLNSATYPVSVDTAAGVLVITGYSGNEFGGTVSYAYTLQDDVAHATGAGANNAFDNFAVSVTDEDGSEANQVLSVRIVDDLPQAVNDGPFNVTEDAVVTTVTGNAISNDNSFADEPATFVSWTTTTSTVLSQYGTLTLAPNGDYTFVLNNADADTQALNPGETRTETFQYTMRDADGDPSTAVLTIAITGSDDGVGVIGIGTEGGDQVVFENDLVDGSSPDAAALTKTGSFTIDAQDGIATVQVGSLTLTVGQLLNLSSANQSVDTPAGLLTLTGYSGTAQGGTVSYSYTLQDNVAHSTGGGANSSFDNFAVTVTDEDGSQRDAVLAVRIVDDLPTALDDTDSVTEDTLLVATGNVVTAVDVAGGDGNTTDGVLDVLGADRLSGTGYVTGVRTGDEAGSGAAGTVGVALNGQYGTLVLNADGSYNYTLYSTQDEAHQGAVAAVQALNGGEQLTDTFTYTITDNDGDNNAGQLTLTINGTDDVSFSVTVNDEGPEAAGAAVGISEQELADNAATFTIALNGTLTVGNTASVTLDFPGTASDGIDYTSAIETAIAGATGSGITYNSTTNVLTFTGGGATSLSFTLTAINDDLLDSGETIQVHLSAPIITEGQASVAAALATATITDNDAAATFAVTVASEATGNDAPNGSATIAEQLSADDTGTFTITKGGDALTGANTASVTITVSGTGEDADFSGMSGNDLAEIVAAIRRGGDHRGHDGERCDGQQPGGDLECGRSSRIQRQPHGIQRRFARLAREHRADPVGPDGGRR